MRHLLRLFSLLLATFVSAASMSGVPAFAQEPELKGAGLGLQMLEQLEWTRLGADSVTERLKLVVWEDEYCLPPDEPNKAKEEEFLKATEKTLQTYIERYNNLRPKFLTLFANDGKARNAVLAKLPREANPIENSFWQPWQTAFQKARRAIQAKRKELESKPEKPCRSPVEQPPPPPPPPVGPGIDLPPVEVRAVDIPPVPARFCSAAEKQKTLNAFAAVAWAFYLNYQDAGRYEDAISRALRDGAGNRAVLEGLLPQAHANRLEHQKRLDEFHAAFDRAKAMPIVDCGGAAPSTATSTGVDIVPQPDYEMFVWPAVPNRFCTEAEKQAVLSQLQFAKEAARRNYEKANAQVTTLGKRIAAGDKTSGLPAAQHQARQSATTYYNLWIDLDRAYYKAQAMPIVDCGEKVGDDHTTGTGAAQPDYALRFAGEFGAIRMGSGGFFGFEVSPVDRGVGSVRPNLSADARGLTAEIDISLGSSYRSGIAEAIFDAETTEVFVRPRFSAFEGDARASGLFETPGSTLLPGLGGPGEAGFSLGVFPGFSNDIEWRYSSEQRIYDFGVEVGETAGLGTAGAGKQAKVELAVGAGYYTATRDERMEFEISDFGASGSYSVKSDIDAPYLALRAGLTYPFGGGAGWTPYVKGEIEGRVYFYDAQAYVRFDPDFAASQFRNLGDSGTEFGWSAGLEAGVDIDAAAMQLYVGYRHMENELSPIADIPGGVSGTTTLGVTTNDIDVVIVGARVRF